MANKVKMDDNILRLKCRSAFDYSVVAITGIDITRPGSYSSVCPGCHRKIDIRVYPRLISRDAFSLCLKSSAGVLFFLLIGVSLVLSDVFRGIPLGTPGPGFGFGTIIVIIETIILVCRFIFIQKTQIVIPRGFHDYFSGEKFVVRTTIASEKVLVKRNPYYKMEMPGTAKSEEVHDGTSQRKIEKSIQMESEDGHYDTILGKADKLLLCAFLVEATPDASMGVFQKTVLLQGSESELKEKIRAQCGSSNADVLIIPPSAWGPPILRSVSQQDLTQNFPAVLSSAEAFLKRHGRADLNMQMLSKTGIVMPNPVSGKVFFVFKIEPLVSVDASSIEQASLLHDKGREQMNAGQLEDAYASFEKALSICDSIILLDPKNADAFFVKALSSGLMVTVQLKLHGSADKALGRISKEAFKSMVAVAPHNYDADRIKMAKAMLGGLPDIK